MYLAEEEEGVSVLGVSVEGTHALDDLWSSAVVTRGVRKDHYRQCELCGTLPRKYCWYERDGKFLEKSSRMFHYMEGAQNAKRYQRNFYRLSKLGGGGRWATALVGPKSQLWPHSFWTAPLKGILPQTIFYRPNLIFWIVMGCGKARFIRNGKKNTKKMKNLVPKFVPLDLEATRTWDLEATHTDLKATCDWTSRQPAMIGNKLYHTPGSKGGGACGAISSYASWGVV